MTIRCINPATEEEIGTYSPHSPTEVMAILENVAEARTQWRRRSVQQRLAPLQALASLIEGSETHAQLITGEMGKPLSESRAEVDKCARLCRYYSEKAAEFLADEPIESEGGKSFVTFDPLGTILGIMPWNFPFWQVFRFAVPALVAGNGAVLKHAHNVTGCALAIEQLFQDAGFPEHLFRTVVLPGLKAEVLIDHPEIAAVAVTGSERAGMAVASHCGKMLKKTVLELGGSDPFIVLADADLEAAVETAAKGRLLNCGQSCIAAKRFLIEESVHDRFVEALVEVIKGYRQGDPLEEATAIGPLARRDLCETLASQVDQSLAGGAEKVYQGKHPDGPGYFYPPTVLSIADPSVPAFEQETFGPVFAVMKVKDAKHAVQVANLSSYGLGGAVWTRDRSAGEALARQIESGTVVVNGMTHSDPALPFGGIKRSGYGRELSHYGLKEFVNVKTIKVCSTDPT